MVPAPKDLCIFLAVPATGYIFNESALTSDPGSLRLNSSVCSRAGKQFHACPDHFHFFECYRDRVAVRRRLGAYNLAEAADGIMAFSHQGRHIEKQFNRCTGGKG